MLEPPGGLGRNRPRLPGTVRAMSGVLAWHRPVWRYRPSPWARHHPLPSVRLRVPPWMRDPAPPRRPPWRLPAWWRPGRPAGRGVDRWDRAHWTWRRPGRPPRRRALSTLGRPTGAGANPSGGPRTGGWRPDRAVAACPGRRAGPGDRPGPLGRRRPTRQGRRGGRGNQAVVRAWRHRSRGRRFPARRRAGRAGSRSPGRSGALATSRSRHRPRKGWPGRAPRWAARPVVGWWPGSRAGPSGQPPDPEGWRRRGGRTRASPRPGVVDPASDLDLRRSGRVARPLPFRSAPRRPAAPPPPMWRAPPPTTPHPTPGQEQNPGPPQK